MPSPFPGMNPYLENPDLWAEVHHRLITAMAIALAPALRPRYRVAIEKRVYLSDTSQGLEVGIPDLSVLRQSTRGVQPTATLPSASETSILVTLPVPQEIRESYLEVREVATATVITVIEVLSPTNKRVGKGRDSYEEKRQDVLQSSTHLVEIDLLRAGKPMQLLGEIPPSDYRILVARQQIRPRAELYPFNLPQPLPAFPLPLQPNDTEPSVELQPLLHQIYDQAGFDLTLNYHADPAPPLSAEDTRWLDALLKQQSLR
jgi:hypothetical protein